MVSLRLRPKQQVPAGGPAATALPAVARPALALLLVTPDGGRLGPRHPHSWHVRARFAAEHAASGQVLIDSAAARALLAAETELLEGRYLNELAPFDQPDCQPTVENVLAVLFDRLEARAHAVGLHI